MMHTTNQRLIAYILLISHSLMSCYNADIVSGQKQLTEKVQQEKQQEALLIFPEQKETQPVQLFTKEPVSLSIYPTTEPSCHPCPFSEPGVNFGGDSAEEPVNSKKTNAPPSLSGPTQQGQKPLSSSLVIQPDKLKNFHTIHPIFKNRQGCQVQFTAPDLEKAHVQDNHGRSFYLRVFKEVPTLQLHDLVAKGEEWWKYHIHITFPEQDPCKEGYVRIGESGLKGGGGQYSRGWDERVLLACRTCKRAIKTERVWLQGYNINWDNGKPHRWVDKCDHCKKWDRWIEELKENAAREKREEENKRKAQEEAERLRKQQQEEENKRKAQEEAERLRKQLLEEENKRKAQEEAERLRKQLLEEEDKRKAQEEAKKLRKQQQEEEDKRKAQEEAERLRKQLLEEENKRKAQEEEEARQKAEARDKEERQKRAKSKQTLYEQQSKQRGEQEAKANRERGRQAKDDQETERASLRNQPSHNINQKNVTSKKKQKSSRRPRSKGNRKSTKPRRKGNSFWDRFKRFLRGVGSWFRMLGKSFAKIGKALAKWISKFGRRIFRAISQLGKYIARGLKKLASYLGKLIRCLASNTWEWMKKAGKWIWKHKWKILIGVAVVAAVAVAWWLIASAGAVGGPGAALGGIAKGSAFKTFFTKIGSALWSKGASLFHSIQQYGATVIDFLATNAGKILSVVWEYKGVIGGRILLKQLGGSIVDLINETPNAFPTTAENVPTEKEEIKKEEATEATKTQEEETSKQEEVLEELSQLEWQEGDISQEKSASSQKEEVKEASTQEEISQLQAKIKALKAELSKKLERILEEIREKKMQENSKQSNNSSTVNPGDISKAAEEVLKDIIEEDKKKAEKAKEEGKKEVKHEAVCNIGICKVFNKLTGSNELNGKLANQMMDHFANPDNNWEEITLEQAQERANEGHVVVTGWKNPNEHKSGHVAVVVPSTRPDGKGEYSGEWKCDVPMTMDTGEGHRWDYKKLSEGFGKNKKNTVKFYRYIGPIKK